MPHPGKPSSFPKPHTVFDTRRGTLRFYLGDCLDVLAALRQTSVSVVVTSPPYNLGVQYRSDHEMDEHYLKEAIERVRKIVR